MLASELLRADSPDYESRLQYVKALLLESAEILHEVEVLGFGATAAYHFGRQRSREVVPAMLVAWPQPRMGRAVFENGDLLNVQSKPPRRSDMYSWLEETGFLYAFRLPGLASAGQVVVTGLPRPVAQGDLGLHLPLGRFRQARDDFADAAEWVARNLRSPGQAAHCSGPTGPGTFGARVRSNGVDSLLTAGHVAPVGGGTPVYDSASNLVGKVALRMCCDFDGAGAAVAPNSDVPDVAVIELSILDHVTSVTKQGVARIRDIVTAHGSVTSGKRSELSTVATAFAGPGSANWGEAMLTQFAISARQDSGAPVVNASGELIGQVVGGYPGVYSVIQDIDYLLNATGAVLR
jgi:hypothetical protein